MKRLPPWVALLLPAAAALACAAPQTAATAPGVDPGRVRIEEAGFSLVLPAGWEVAGPFAIESGAAGYSLYALGVDPGASGGPGMSQIVVADAARLRAEALIAAQCSTCPARSFADAQLGGLPAARSQVGGGGVPFTVEWTFVEHDGRPIGFSIRDAETLATLEVVLASAQFDAGATS